MPGAFAGLTEFPVEGSGVLRMFAFPPPAGAIRHKMVIGASFPFISRKLVKNAVEAYEFHLAWRAYRAFKKYLAYRAEQEKMVAETARRVKLTQEMYPEPTDEPKEDDPIPMPIGDEDEDENE